jgi:hypothetical protein
MPDSLQRFIQTHPVIDVHEHHLPELWRRSEVGLQQLLQQSYAGWAKARPYILPGETRDADPMLEAAGKTSWEELAAFLEHHGSNSFVRNLIEAISELYGDGRGRITRENWEALDHAITRQHARADWPDELLRRAGIERVITDVYTDPLFDAQKGFGPHYRSVMRINALACGWHPESSDHNGNRGQELLRRIGGAVTTFDDYVRALEQAVDSLASRHQVALKNALAYDRGVDFDAPNKELARRAWGKPSPPAEEQKAFGDFVVDRLCHLAGERDLPVQMHLGTAQIRGSHPLKAAGLVERHPRTRFLLMHLAYPWSRDLLGMAFVYRNIWLDLTWAALISPSHFKLALHEAIEVLPDESRLMIGGDNWHAEETYGAIMRTRRILSEVLEEKVRSGYFHESDARRLGAKILQANAAGFFALI